MLGQIADKDGVYPDPEKVRTVKDFPRPTDVRSTQSNCLPSPLPIQKSCNKDISLDVPENKQTIKLYARFRYN